MPDHVGDRGAVRLDLGASRSPTYQPDPDTEQLDRGTASAGCGHGAAGKTRVRALELTGMAVMVAPGSGIGRVMQRGYQVPSGADAAHRNGCAGPLSGRAGR